MAKQKLTPEEKAQRKADRKAKFKAMNEKNGTRWQAVKYLLCTASAGIIQFVSFTIMTYAFGKTRLGHDKFHHRNEKDDLRRNDRRACSVGFVELYVKPQIHVQIGQRTFPSQ